MISAGWFRVIGKCKYCKKDFRKREKKYKFCSLSCSNNFNKNGLKPVKLPKLDNNLAEFIGICLGDGYISKYQISITLNSIADREYIPYVINLARNLFSEVNISLVKKTSVNAIDIRINSVIVSKFICDMGLIPNKKRIPEWILKNNNFKIACIRGLFDTEGSISFKKYKGKNKEKLYKQLNFRNYDKEIMRFVRDSLISFGLNPTKTLNKSLYLSTHKSISRFREVIGFSNPKLLNKSFILEIEDIEN